MQRKEKNEQLWRNIVRSRDNWICQKCGRIEYLQAHHYKAPKDYPLFANLPENGITLCVYCHVDAHPEAPRNLFISTIIKAEKEGCISAGKLAKELCVNPRTIVRRAVKLGILKPMQKWMFTKKEADLLRAPKRKTRGNVRDNLVENTQQVNDVCDEFVVRVPIEVGREIRKLAGEQNKSFSCLIAQLLADA